MPEAEESGKSSIAGDATPTYVAPRTCKIVDEGEANREANKRAVPLSDYADAAAYVLISRSRCRHDNGVRDRVSEARAKYVTVRNFRTYDDKPEWHGTTLFLDGLDGSRAGTRDGPGWPDAA